MIQNKYLTKSVGGGEEQIYRRFSERLPQAAVTSEIGNISSPSVSSHDIVVPPTNICPSDAFLHDSTAPRLLVCDPKIQIDIR
jgi:hypothetical protein